MRTGIVWIVLCIMIAAVVSVCLVACGSKSSSDPAPSVTDSISITSISPASAVTGTNTSFAVEVSYSLASKDSGLLMVGFNTNKVDSYSMISSQTYTVAKGSGTHIFTATATAVDWGSTGTFQAYVNLSENPHPAPWTPLASDTKTISTSSSAAPIVGISANAFKSTTNSVQCDNAVCL